MLCKSVNPHLKNSNTTAAIFIGFIFIIWYLNLILPLDIIFNNKYFIIISYIIIISLVSWVNYHDPTSLCGNVYKENCRYNKFKYNCISLCISKAPFLFFMTQLYTDSLLLGLVITFIVTLTRIFYEYYLYTIDINPIINDPKNQMLCQRNRIFWNVVLLIWLIFLNFRIIKEFNVHIVLKKMFNFPDVVNYVISVVYIFVVMIWPTYLGVKGVDQSVKYGLDQIVVT
jgi:hypothetical protein